MSNPTPVLVALPFLAEEPSPKPAPERTLCGTRLQASIKLYTTATATATAPAAHQSLRLKKHKGTRTAWIR